MTSFSSSPDPARGDATQPVADLTRAPLPTQATLRRRRSVPFQVGRFVAFNLRILRITAKPHH